MNSNCEILGIIQARMGSQRLPGKTLLKIKDQPLIKYCYTGALKSKRVGKWVIATSINVENDPLQQFCELNNIPCFRGSEKDVLDRFYQCAKKYIPKIIVRITGDCPFTDSNIIDRSIEYFLMNNFDVIINTWFYNSYPSGFDVEVFTFETLEKQWKEEDNMATREHVINTLRNKRFRVGRFVDIKKDFISNLKFDFNQLHLSVDTINDFLLIEEIIIRLGEKEPTFENIIEIINSDPEILKINFSEDLMQKIKQNKNIL